MRVWIVNPYDNLPLEGYRPQRFWLMARAFCAAGCETTLWTSSFSHANKRQRVLPQDGVETVDAIVSIASNHGNESLSIAFEKNASTASFTVRLVKTPGYRRNIGFGRIVDHWLLAKRWRKLAERTERPDLIIASSPPLGLVAEVRKFAQANGVPYIVDVMDAWPETFERVLPRFVLKALGLYRLARANYLGAAGISVVARRYAELVRGYGYKGEVREFLHGIELKKVAQADVSGQKAVKPSEEMLRLAYVGNMSLSYDLSTLIAAVQQLTDVTLDLAGDGPDRVRLEKAVRERGVGGRIRFHGYLGESELNALLAECDVGVIPMWPTSCVGVPYKLADYAAAGLRVIESLGGETEEIVQRFKAGMHYEAGNVESLKLAVKSVSADRSVPNCDFATHFDANEIYRDYVQAWHLRILVPRIF